MPDQPLFEQLNRAIESMLAGGGTPAEPAGLIEIVRRLRDLPDENFKPRLKADLERRKSMPVSAPAQIREGFRTVTPYISVAEGDKLIEFMKQTFGAEVVSRHMAPSGHFHAEIRLGDSMLMIGFGESFRGHENPIALHVYVDDCDAAYARAIAAGAEPWGGAQSEPADRPYGERSGHVRDAFGNYWYVATRLAGNDAPEGYGSVLPYLHPVKARPFIDFLKRAFGAEEMGVYEHEGRVMHAAVKIGDAVLEMGEAGGEFQPLPSAFFMYVKDADAVYNSAIAAGATSIRPPVNQPYGHREAALMDPFGNTWYPATPIS